MLSIFTLTSESIEYLYYMQNNIIQSFDSINYFKFNNVIITILSRHNAIVIPLCSHM